MYQGHLSAKAQLEGTLAKADEYDLVADEAILTHHFNTKERNKRTTSLAYQTMAQGLDEAGVLGLSGMKTVENMRAEGGSSGAALGAGTTNEVIINQHLQNANVQLRTMQQTDEKITNLEANAKAVNRMEDYRVKQKVAQLRRAANTTRSGADSAYFAAMLGTFTNSVNTYMASGGEFSTDSFKKPDNKTESFV